MIEEIAVVSKVTETGVWVTIDRKSACGHCHIAANCGHGVMERFFLSRGKPIELFLEGIADLELNDKVVLGIKPDTLIKSAIWAYAPPLIGLFVGLGLAVALATWLKIQSEWLHILGMVLGLMLGFLSCGWFSERLKLNQEYTPRYLRHFSATQNSQATYPQ